MENPPKRATEDQDKSTVYVVDRTIYFITEVTAESVGESIRHLDKLEKESKKPINMLFSSIGGNCYDGLALYDRIRRSECEIITTATGLVASMSVLLFLAGDYRHITENAILLNHQTSADMDGKVTDLKIEMDEIVKLEELTVELIAERTGQQPKKIKSEVKLGDCYIRAERALEEGYAHELIQNKRTIRRRKRKTK